jgi:hypothetical protein
MTKKQKTPQTHTKHDIAQDLVIRHLDVPNGDTQAKDLFQLELDRGTDIIKLVGKILGVRDGGGELSGFGETGSEQTGDLLDQSFGGQEGVILLSELLDELLVFVEPGA